MTLSGFEKKHRVGRSRGRSPGAGTCIKRSATFHLPFRQVQTHNSTRYDGVARGVQGCRGVTRKQTWINWIN